MKTLTAPPPERRSGHPGSRDNSANISSAIIGWGFPWPHPGLTNSNYATSMLRLLLSNLSLVAKKKNPVYFGPLVQVASRLYSSLGEASEDQNRSVHAWGINNTSLGGGLREAVPVAAEPERIREYKPGRFHPLRPSDAVIRPVEVNGQNEKKSDAVSC